MCQNIHMPAGKLSYSSFHKSLESVVDQASPIQRLSKVYSELSAGQNVARGAVISNEELHSCSRAEPDGAQDIEDFDPPPVTL